VLYAGVEVLRTVGHGQFSVQKVARAAGVYQGNVTYYWPRRRDLVLALAVRIVEDYLRTFEERAAGGDDRAQLALDVYVHRIRKYLGAYAAVLGPPERATGEAKALFDNALTHARTGDYATADVIYQRLMAQARQAIADQRYADFLDQRRRLLAGVPPADA
jgi:AcrR family transcriptional regulator